MALSYTGRRNLFGSLANNSSSTVLTLADTLMNSSEKRILSSRQWSFLERQYTTTTVASTASYVIPMYAQRVQSVYVTVSSRRFAPMEATSRAQWDTLNEIAVTSDIPTWWYQFDGSVELFPRPSTSSNTITFNTKRTAKDLSIADYTTGNIDIITNGSTSVTGAGSPAWTTPMAGRFLRVTESNTAASSGDEYWYEIASVTSSTVLVLSRKYNGTSLTTGASAAYIIGQLSLLPEPYDMIPVYEALKVYFTSVEPSAEKAQLYAGLAKEAYTQLVQDYGSKSTSVVIDSGSDYELINPNLTIKL